MFGITIAVLAVLGLLTFGAGTLVGSTILVSIYLIWWYIAVAACIVVIAIAVSVLGLIATVSGNKDEKFMGLATFFAGPLLAVFGTLKSVLQIVGCYLLANSGPTTAAGLSDLTNPTWFWCGLGLIVVPAVIFKRSVDKKEQVCYSI